MLKIQSKHNAKCTRGSLELTSERRNGEDSLKQKPVMNSAAVWETLSTGSTYAHLSEVLSVMDIPAVSKNEFFSIQRNLGTHFNESLWKAMESAGREVEPTDGTLGERVVNAPASTIREKEVTFCFEIFYNCQTSAIIGILSFSRGESSFRCTTDELLFVKWQDTKEVLLMSNCHNTNVTTVTITMKDGSESQVSCPQMIAFYREKMGGVDISNRTC
ncbi:hypothetical protein ILUMI_02577 [Ignelater luminosus]|uniref:Uncharacterized protein n=1 Tax=Ignelater luminosus TaxID=2038154 RepID=A0A8K0DHW8_IGNLU|nr:hypothetical protein ILUMI_02577 [Ignelater luminosus]